MKNAIQRISIIICVDWMTTCKSIPIILRCVGEKEIVMLHHGLYEQVNNNALTSELAEIPEARKAIAPIDKAEASKVLAQYLADVVQKGLDNVLDNGGDISAHIALTNQIVDLIQNTTKEADFAALGVDQRAEQLLALLR